MRRRFLTLFSLILIVVVIFVVSSCTIKKIIVVRVPFEDLTSGAFYNGSLAFNTSDDEFSQIGPGTTIGFQDITYGWEQDEVDEDYFLPIILTRDYGYIYIREISELRMTYDYLIYGPDGIIKERKDNVTVNLVLGEAQFTETRGDAFHGLTYHRGVTTNHPSIGDSCLLSFKNETPEELVTGSAREYAYHEQFKRVVFRIEHSGNATAPQFSKGLIAISVAHPRSLVVNSTFLSRYDLGEPPTSTHIAFYKNDNLPDFYEGDFILDEQGGLVRQVESVDLSNDDYVLIQATESTMEDALGTVVIDVDDDLATIIERYGSTDDKQRLARVRKNLYEKEWDIPLYDGDGVTVEIQNTFDLNVDCSIKFHLSWKSFSSSGHLSFPMDFSSILVIDALAGFEKDDDYRLADPGISFSICGVPVRVSVPLDFYYDVSAQIAEFEFDFGPELDLELGFSYDIGAKVKFKWHVIPDGLHKWSHAHGIYNHSEEMHGPEYTAEVDPSLSLGVGFKTYPGITIACVLRPQLEIPFGLEFNLKDKHLTLDFETSGELEMELDIKIYHHTYHFGKVFEYSKQLYEHDF
ncbi:MAG TPA: hypothetical protein PK466_10000 [Thermotogota bacterium]|nr:hypothetical protein [Thermotogota bacterium]HPJ88605.1 hypothetical protein [Thermotogota bacterium]HPR96655.1 hypothetical protein [Thermotogota bacterium]